MKPLEINLIDSNIGNQNVEATFNIWHSPEDIVYYKPPNTQAHLPTLFTDEQMLFADGLPEEFKAGVYPAMMRAHYPDLAHREGNGTQIGLFLEPRTIKPIAYLYFEQFPEFVDNFSAIFTHDDTLLSMSDTFKKMPLSGGNYTLEEDCRLYDKTKNISIVASEKIATEGHLLRHEVVATYRDSVDAYGPDYTNLYPDYIDEPTDTLQGKYKHITGNLVRAFRDYRYSIVIENVRQESLFTEKIINCFATGTVPIYWGARDIESRFDEAGIITFNTLEELGRILPILGEKDYNSRRDAMKVNYNKSKEFWSYDDYLSRRLREVLDG